MAGRTWIAAGLGFSSFVALAWRWLEKDVAGACRARWGLNGTLALLGMLVALVIVQGRNEVTARVKPGGAADSSSEDMHSVVILSHKVRRYTILVPTANVKRTGLLGLIAKPLSFPFSGEYWIYFPPYRRPPRSSLMVEGNPIGYKFTAAGRTFLAMEARQSLPAPIAVRCCRRIDLDVRSTDPLPGTLSAELILKDRTNPGKPDPSLGTAAITSVWAAGNSRTSAASKTLRFQILSGAGHFIATELQIVFHLGGARFNRAANVALDRFTLIPR